ncbi:MAG TPA: polysaccharide deacetylase family protein [Bacteroidales bacterium]|nr:polysaccharide deacetylase family protein [Bacteroidales bacterium]
MDNIIQVYTTSVTTRLQYALEIVFTTILGLKYEILTDRPDPERPLINYSNDRSVGGIFIQPEPLLFETGIRKQDIWIAHMDNIPLFFQQPPEAGFFIDIFAFAFYNCSRYEEYLPFRRDEHGRFAAESSMAYKHNFLYLPLVDIWAIKLGHTLEMLYPSVRMAERKYDVLLTVDVDQPFAYRGKGFIRNMAGIFVDIFKGRNFALRFNCMTGKKPDPYDTFNYVNDQARKYKSKVIYFFTAGKKGKFDNNPNPLRRCYKRLIRKLSEDAETGLHPSYFSNRLPKVILKEKSDLEAASKRKINSSRQHFLLLSFPETYQVLQEVGIEKDYTLGYVREAGFRAGIARPFKFYDLHKEESTNLTLIPFQYMDGTLQQYKRLTTDEAKEVIDSLVEETRKVGGLFVSVWHNTSLTGDGFWKGWRDVFEYSLKSQKP